jgi:hypothetical protein
MAGIFSGPPPQQAPQQQIVQAAPTPPKDDGTDPAQLEAARKERLADQRSLGRSDTILTQYALAVAKPNTLKATLGA